MAQYIGSNNRLLFGVLKYIWVEGVLLQRIFLKLVYLERFHFTRTRKIATPWSFKGFKS